MALLLPTLDFLPPGYGDLPPLAPRKLQQEGDPDAAYNALSPEKRAWVDKQLELQDKPRSALGEIGAGVMRGVVSELPRMVGQGLKATGVEGDYLHGLGTKLVAGAAAREPAYAEDISPDAHNAVTQAFAQGGAMLAPSLAPLAALPVLAAAGLPAAAGFAVAGAAGAGLFGASQYQDTYEKAVKEGKTPEEAHQLGLQTGAIEALGESVGTAVGAKFLSGTGLRILGKAMDVPTALRGLRNPQFLKTLAQDFTKTAAVEVGTEMGQNAGEAAVEFKAGIDKMTPWDAATSAVGPTLAMTALLGPMGAISLRAQQRRNAELTRIAEDPNSTPKQVAEATRALQPQLEPLVGKDEAREWRLNALEASNQSEAEKQQRAEQQAAQAEQEARAAQAEQGMGVVAAMEAQRARAEEEALIAHPPEGAMGFSEFAKEQGRQAALAFESGKKSKKEVKLTQDVLRSRYLTYLQGFAQPETATTTATELERAGQARLFPDRGEMIPPVTEQPFQLEPSPRAGAPVTPVETIPFTRENPNQGELDLIPVMNRPAGERPAPQVPRKTQEVKPPTIMEQAFAAAGGRRKFEEESAYAQHRAELEAAKKGSEKTRAAVIEKIARVTAANRLADDAMAGRINGNTPVAVSDLVRTWEETAVANGMDTTVLRGQARARVMQAIKSAGGKKVWMQQLNALRKARDEMKPGTVSRDTFDALVNRLENFNGQAKPVQEDAGQGNAGQGNAQAGQDALLTKEPENAPQDRIVAEGGVVQHQGNDRGGASEESSSRSGAAQRGNAAPAAAKAEAEVTQQVNAAPGAEAAPTPPPVPVEVSGAAPVPVVSVSSTGAEKEGRTVGWGEFASRAPDGTITYATPQKPRSPTTVGMRSLELAGKERFRPQRYHAEVPQRDRRNVPEEKLFGFEILNFNESAGRGTNANTHWATEYTRALKLADQKSADGQPTSAAKNAQAALKWLDEYEGSDIAKRAVLRRIEGIFEVNDRLGLAARERAEQIAEQINYEMENIAMERKMRIAKGMGINEADEWTRSQLLKINNALAKEEAKQRAENRDRTKDRTAQERAQRKAERERIARQYLDLFEEVVKGVMNNDPKIMNLHAALPNYTPTPSLLKQVEKGRLFDVLRDIKENGPSSWTQYLADHFQQLNLKTSIRMIEKVAHDADGARVYARYDHSSNTINVYIGGQNPHTLLHETAHAATVARIAMAKAALRSPLTGHTSEQKAAVASLLDLRNFMAAMRKLDTKHQYAFRSEEEFVAEALSNEKFQQWLSSQTFDARNGWRKFVDWVRELLGASPYEGTNAFEHALSLSRSFESDSRFGEAEGLSFNHSATAAAAQTDSIVSSLVQTWENAAAKTNLIGNMGAKVRAAMWQASTTFNLAQWVDRLPTLRPLVAGIHEFMNADGVKTKLRQTKQLEFSTITNMLKLAYARLSPSQAELMNQRLMGFAGDMSALNIDLNKNFDENRRNNPALDPKNREYINQRHAEYKQLPAEFKKPLEDSFRVFRKNYIQQTAMVLRDTLRIYQKTSPQLNALITLLDIRNAALDEGTNPKPEYYYDAYSANLDKTVRKVLHEARGVSVGKDHLRADINDIEKFYNAAVSNPYMHLGRSGDYYIEFNTNKSPEAWGAVQAAVVPFGKAMGAQNDKGHVFMRFENPAQRDALLKELGKLSGFIDQESLRAGSLFDSDAMNRMQGVPAFVHHLMQRIDTDFKGEEAAAMRQYLKRAYLDALPDSSAQKALVQRKDGGVAGYDLDFMRNFSKRAEGMASMISNAYAMPGYDKAFTSMKDEVAKLERSSTAGQADQANEVFTEMTRRFSNSITPVDSPVIDAFKAFGFNYFLAFSPAFWLTNMVQPYHLTLPYLGGRYGFTNTAKEMGRSTSKAFKLIKAAVDAGWSEGMKVGGTRGALMGILDLSLPIDKIGLSSDEVEFVRRLIESGQLDTTQGHELGRIAAGDSQKMTTLMKTLSMGSHYTEVLNRLTAGLAAYNLSRQKDGKGAEFAVQRGIEAVRSTQFDYSDHNTARALGRHGLAGKVTPLLASFQQYAFQTMELLIRMTADAVAPIPAGASAEQVAAIMADRKAAQRGLAGVLTTSSILAGTLGIPLANAVAAVADRLLGDDDDPMDVKAAYRAWLADVVGKDVAEAVARGVPRAVLGFDTAGRMGMQDILPGTRFMADRRDLKTKLENGAFNLLGPAVSAGTSVYVGTNKMLNGQLMDGLIEMLPLALKGPAKTVKMDDVGFTTSTGNKLPIEVTPWGMVAQTFGFTPAAKAEQSEVNFAFRQRDMLLKQRKNQIANQYYQAVERGEDTTAIMQELMQFNTQNPQYRIDPIAGLKLRAKQRATADITEIPTLPRYLPTLERYGYANVR